MTVSVDGAITAGAPSGTSGSYFGTGGGTNTTWLNPTAPGTSPGAFTTTPVMPANANGVVLQTYFNPCDTTFPASTSCTGLGGVTVTLTDPLGGAVRVSAPKIHITRIGGTYGAMELGSGLQINAGGSTPGIGLAATAAATTTFTVTGGNQVYGNPSAPGTTLNVECGVSATTTAGCGTVQVTGNPSNILFNVTGYRTTLGPNTWGGGSADAYIFDMSFDEDFGGAPASFEGGGTAAGHLLTDLRLGASVSAENTTSAAHANGGSDGTGLLTASPLAAAPGATPGDTNDGVTFPALTTSLIGSTYTVTPAISGASRAGELCGWIDFNRDNVFTAAEGVCNTFASGATSVPMAFTVPVATTAGPAYARFRVTYDTNISIASVGGLFSSGEVEDYLVQIKPAVRVVKALLPAADAGTFNLSINGTNFATGIGNAGTTNFRSVYHTDTPDVTVAANVTTAAITGVVLTETAAGATNLTNYVTTSACVNAAGTAVTVGGTALAPSVTIPQSVPGASGNGQAQTITCTLTNTRNATLTLAKNVTNNNGGTAADTAFTLMAAGPATISGTEGASAITNANVVPGTYSLSETGPSGYAASTWSCTAGTLAGADLTLAAGQVATCTITNDDVAPRLTLLKTVTNDNGGTNVDTDFTLTATGPTTITGVEGGAAVTNAAVNAGTYVLSESGAATANYTQGTWSCTAGTLTGNSLVLAIGQTASCTITNNDRPRLTLLKTVVNDNGGTALDTAFTLTATGPVTISGVEGNAAVTNAVVNAGTYALTESALAGYAGGAWSCVGGSLAGSNLTLTQAQNATCTVTNNDQPVTLTLTKIVVNTGGGSAGLATFPLTASGPVTITGTSGTAPVTNAAVNSGTYLLSEVANSNYTASAWSCSAGTLTGNSLVLALGQTSSCTITNTFVPAPALTIDKTANTAGPLQAGQTVTYNYVVTNTGNVTISGVTVTETAFNGTGTPPVPATGGSTTLAPGQSVSFSAPYLVMQQDVDTLQ